MEHSEPEHITIAERSGGMNILRLLVIDDFCVYGIKKSTVWNYSGMLKRMLGMVTKGRNYV